MYIRARAMLLQSNLCTFVADLRNWSRATHIRRDETSKRFGANT